MSIFTKKNKISTIIYVHIHLYLYSYVIPLSTLQQSLVSFLTAVSVSIQSPFRITSKIVAILCRKYVRTMTYLSQTLVYYRFIQ